MIRAKISFPISTIWSQFVDNRPYLFWFQLFYVYHTDYWRGKTKPVLRCYLIRLWKILYESKYYRRGSVNFCTNLIIEKKCLAFKDGRVCFIVFTTNCWPSQGLFQFTFSQTTLELVLNSSCCYIILRWWCFDPRMTSLLWLHPNRLEGGLNMILKVSDFGSVNLSSTSFTLQKTTAIDLISYCTRFSKLCSLNEHALNWFRTVLAQVAFPLRRTVVETQLSIQVNRCTLVETKSFTFHV